jgi:hypothetical protein
MRFITAGWQSSLVDRFVDKQTLETKNIQTIQKLTILILTGVESQKCHPLIEFLGKSPSIYSGIGGAESC